MTPSQRTRLERHLAEFKTQVEHRMRDRRPKAADEKSVERVGVTLDEGDEAAERLEEAFNQTLHDRYLNELRQIEAAYERCTNGNIDRCADCGGEIQFERLLAYPLALRCTRCQARHEKTYGGTQTPKL